MNGKVERSQRTDLEEFYATANLTDPGLPGQLQHWQEHYNRERRHGSLEGQTPWQRWLQLTASTLSEEEVRSRFDVQREGTRCQNSDWDFALQSRLE